jgi:hypothetical protein
MFDPKSSFRGLVSIAAAGVLLGGLCASAVAAPKSDAKPAADVKAVTGMAVATDGVGGKRELRPGDSVYEGETIHTADGARVELKLVDNSDMYIRQRSEVKMQAYHMDPEGNEPGNAIVDLLTGGLRVVTGLIGKKPGDNYQVKTPTGTLGIRGTDYVLIVCETGDCILNDFAPTTPYTPGVYTGTVFGAVTVENQAGRHSIPRDGVYKIESANGDPQAIANPPVFYSGNMPNAAPGVSCWRAGRMQPCPTEFEVSSRK